MSRWKLLDIDNNSYTIPDDSLRILERSFKIETDIIEKSFRAGADFPGIQRDTSAEIGFKYDYNINDEQTFRTYLNTLIMNLRKSVILQDTVNQIQTDILLSEKSISYDEGGFNFGSQNEITFKQLRPFWEDIISTDVSFTGYTSGQVIIDNQGYIETPPVITLYAEGPVTKISIRVNETGEGIVIKDLQFGSLGLNVYIIDCKEGTSELSGVNRNNMIQNGTGFFNLKVGTNTLQFEFDGNRAVDISYKKRYWI